MRLVCIKLWSVHSPWLVFARSRLNWIVNTYLMLDILSLIHNLCENLSSHYGYSLIFSVDKIRLCFFQSMRVKCCNISLWGVLVVCVFLNSVTWCQCCQTIHVLGADHLRLFISGNWSDYRCLWSFALLTWAVVMRLWWGVFYLLVDTEIFISIELAGESAVRDLKSACIYVCSVEDALNFALL